MKDEIKQYKEIIEKITMKMGKIQMKLKLLLQIIKMKIINLK